MEIDGNLRTGPVAGHGTFAGSGGRRRWPDKLKARLVAESHADGTKAGEVARRAGLPPSHLPHWRRQVREGTLAMPGAGGADFVELEAAAAPAPEAGGWLEIARRRAGQATKPKPGGLNEIAEES